MKRLVRRRLWLCALGLWLASAPAASAQDSALADAEAQLAQLEQELSALDAQTAQHGANALTAAQRESLEALQRTTLRRRDLLRGQQALLDREQEAEARLASGPSGQLAQPPPYVLAVLDALADARDAQRQRGETLRAALDAAKQAQQAADEAFESAEQARRRAAEAAEQGQDAPDAAALRAAQRQSELESRGAGARRELAQLEQASLERQLALQRRDEQLLDDTVRWVRDRLVVESAPEQTGEAQLRDREFDAQRTRMQAEREVASAERQLAEAERRLEAEPASPVRRAEVAARRAAIELWQGRAEASTTALDRVGKQRALEAQRLQALSGEAARRELLEWETQLSAGSAENERTLRLLEVQRGEAERKLGLARAELSEVEPAARAWVTREIEALEELRALHDREAAEWKRFGTLASRARSEIAEITAQPGLSDRLDDATRSARSAWQLELFAVDDRPITLGKIATGLLLFLLGFVVARLVSRLVGRLLVRRAKLATGAATAIQGLLFYLLLVVFFLLALRSVSIPLTAFTVLGGALAIGVGFGSQNIVNNFISGLILLAERPIKVGDLIEVEGQRGHVEWIGARSTRVRTFDNIHIVVPNSVFLERPVVNWTLADDDVRGRVDVGVAYGSPTREVQRLLRRAVEEQEKVLETPAPAVFFMEFAESALLFRAYFWIRSRDMGERLQIESEIRFRIEELCREAGIHIAFPQRDVHLAVREPLAIRVVGEDAGEE